jgi:hypothetical protein
MLTEKENLMRVLNGEVPEWVPRLEMVKNPYATKPMSTMFMGLPILRPTPGGVHKDIWGVEYTPTKETGDQALPTPNKFILKDIRDWPNVIKAPDMSHLDYDKLYQEALKNAPVGPDDAVTIMGAHSGYFQIIMNFMGFNEGLMALMEEPETCKELLEYVANFYEPIFKKAVNVFKPDVFQLADDTATAINPFISPEMFRDIIKPFHMRMAKIGQDAGCKIMMHNCGRCEDFIEDWFDYGVTSWNPAQRVNDLDGIKKKYGNKFQLIGCWDSQGPAGRPDVDDDFLREQVRWVIDHFGEGGGFIFWGSIYGVIGDPEMERHKKIMTEEYERWRDHPYK